ncbi:glycosyltransferase family 2 protein [Bifidobacterium aquikefiricola]|uniref:cellulose synthase (UDP-forming) n=1 Tax=Bifidobacterium aquikefiricola TaxID=3059038 RepID=A0AB39U4Q6_9BIFI
MKSTKLQQSSITKQNLIFALAIVLMSIYLVWRLFFTLPIHDGTLNMVVAVMLYIAEAITIFTTFDLFFQRMRADSFVIDRPSIEDQDFPDVDVFVATHNEAVSLLSKTVYACTCMDYPDKAKLHVFICDDGNRAEVAQLADELHVGYLGLADNTHAKSGNYNNALAHTHSPLVATFDADMIPRHDFLVKTIPYFLVRDYIQEQGAWRKRDADEHTSDEKPIGLVQTPQSFYNPDLFQFNLYAEKIIPNEQDFFSREINILRNTSNSVAYTGSNAILSRKALEDIGGFPLNTITEDFEVSLRMQQNGYITYATNEVLSSGLATTTVSAMIHQRTRWARGIIQSLQNTHPFRTPGLSFQGKLAYLWNFLYWWSFVNRLIFITSPILFALFNFRIVVTGLGSLILIWLPAYICYASAMRFLSGSVRNQRWSQVIDTILMPYMIFPVLLETLHIHQRSFKVTDKRNVALGARAKSNLLLAVPNIILLLFTLAALVHFVWGKYGWSLFFGSVIIFWLTYNLVSLTYSLFFMLGRPAYRRSERFTAHEQLDINLGGQIYKAYTIDISEEGMGIHSDVSLYFDESQDVALRIHTDRYESELLGRMIYAQQVDDGWRYSLVVRAKTIADQRKFFQIIYDRQHALPQQMDFWDTAYDDFVRNVMKRLQKPSTAFNRFSTMVVRDSVRFDDGTICTRASIGYRSWTVAHLQAATGMDTIPSRLSFTTESGMRIELMRTGQMHGDEETLQVANLHELASSGMVSGVIENIAATVTHPVDH